MGTGGIVTVEGLTRIGAVTTIGGGMGTSTPMASSTSDTSDMWVETLSIGSC